MLALGIDPGTRVTGYGAVAREGGRFVCSAYAALRPDPAAPLGARLLHLHDEIDAAISRLRPDVVAVEDCFYAKNARSTLKLGHVKGLVLLLAARHGIPLFEYAPRRVKQAVVGRGGASKEQVRFMIARMVAGLDAAEDCPLDITDALAVAICHHHTHATALATLGAGRAATGGGA